MELIEIANEIRKKIKLLEEGRKLIQQRAGEKAVALAEYEKQLAVYIIRLRNGETFSVDGYQIGNKKVPATLAKDVAKGLCYDAKIAMETADGLYKSAVVGMSAIEAELNGFQSLNRYLDKL